MDLSSSVLGCVLLLQMSVILVMLNPAYDLRKIRSLFFTSSRICSLTIISYFTLVVYLGMYVPLLNISKLISNEITCEYEKLTILGRIEKNYIIAGFSLFLFIVMYGVRALDIYATRIAQMLVNTNDTVFSQPLVREKRSQRLAPLSQESILPKLLKMKRSVSYETILFAKEFRALKAIIKNARKDSQDKN
ncbi:uncharacterized protein LOC125050076 [Pieris napi]|uniref:uncharacterized protein LOC125050076 n=1 Tax=Pieris napi TaxID=78633 RepID=UPI001FBBDCF2|nr:uncharacterized protein LOC125050076 [Pieris napi]